MTINPTTQFDSLLAEAAGFDVNLLALARQRSQSFFGTQVQTAINNELLEPGWVRSGEGAGGKIQGYTREQMNAVVRYYAMNDPMVAHAINLHGVYTFGRGVEPVASDERIQAAVNDFWDEPGNHAAVATSQAQYTLNKNRLIDGEIFFLFYVSTVNGMVRIRPLDPAEIKEVIYAENDPMRPVYYKREYKVKEFDFKTGKHKKPVTVKCYLPDYRNSRPDHSLYASMKLGTTTQVYVYHMCSNPCDGRGLSHLATAMAWVRAFKGFMEDRVTLQMALALFAFKTKVKGNQNAIDRVMGRWSQYENPDKVYGSGEVRERRPGSTNLFENEAITTEQFKVDTGASNAYMDGRMLRQMVGIGLGGIFEHYLAGDASTGNLATATAMELPMLKMFESEQELWGDVYKEILNFVIYMRALFDPKFTKLVIIDDDELFGIWRLRPYGKTDISVAMRFPDIVARDVGVWLSGLAGIKNTEAMIGYELMPRRESRMVTMELFGLEDAADLADKMALADEEAEAEPAEPEAPPAEQEPPAEDETEPPAAEQAARQPSVLVVRPDLEDLARRVITERVGKPLPADKAEDMDDITEEELEDSFDEFEEMPGLDELLDELGVDPDDLEDND